jgi:COP9 signalosome complex subunit 1
MLHFDRDYCVNGVQHWNVCLLLVEMSIDLREWGNARETISRAEHTVLGDSGDPLFPQKLRAASALVHLAEGRYHEAAKVFCSVSLDLTNQFNTVLSAEDISLYGALLGLATLDRENLHAMVIDGPFKARLEFVPSIRDALRHYSLAEYGQCISILQNAVRRDVLLDIHLHPHVSTLLDMIRDRCIVQYFKPYSSASLEKMGRVFGHTPSEMEEIVAKLIANSGVQGMTLGEGARINSLEKTLSVYSEGCIERKARRRARVNAAKMGVEFFRNAEGVIMRELNYVTM